MARKQSTTRFDRTPSVLVLVFALASCMSGAAQADLVISPDTTVGLGGFVHADEDAVFLNNPNVSLDLGILPRAAAVSALGIDPKGDVLFSLDTTVSLPGGIVAEPRDVVRYDGVSHSIAFDGSAAGVPDGTRIDAINYTQEMLFSFDTTVLLPGGLIAEDEDLVEWNGFAFVSPLFFDASAEGVSRSLDLDGAQRDVLASLLLVSFDTAGSVAGVVFDDEDILAYDLVSGSWTLFEDTSVLFPALSASDVDGVVAVPEPGTVLALLGGAGLLAWLRRRRGMGMGMGVEGKATSSGAA